MIMICHQESTYEYVHTAIADLSLRTMNCLITGLGIIMVPDMGFNFGMRLKPNEKVIS